MNSAEEQIETSSQPQETIFPLYPIIDGRCGCPAGVSCKTIGKHPSRRWKHLEAGKQLPIPPGCGHGICTGKRSGFFVVDLDVDPAKDLDGRVAFEALAAGRDLPPTHLTSSGNGRGGGHLRFNLPDFEIRNSASVLGPGIDVRGEGGMVVGPGSPHKSGGVYRVVLDAPVADAPGWLLDLLREIEAKRGAKKAPKIPSKGTAVDPANLEDLEEIEEKCAPYVPIERRVELAQVWAAGEEPAVSQESGHDRTMRVVSYATRAFFLTDADAVFEAIAPWNATCTPPWEGAELAHKIEDALTASSIPWGGDNDLLAPGWLPLLPWCDRYKPAAAANDADAEICALRPCIHVDTNLSRVVDECSTALRRDTNMFQRAGELVRITRQAENTKDAREVAGTPQLRNVPPSTLKERLTKIASFTRTKVTKDGFEEIPTTPADDVVAALAQRGEWQSVRPIAGIVETPTLRPDGTVMQIPGYDDDTAYLYMPGSACYAEVPENPTHADAVAALADLADVFCDFPYATPAGVSAAVAAILTIVGRPAISGNVPAFLFDAATAGSGKTLQVDVIALVATGRIVPKVTFPSNDVEELEKRLGGYAMKGSAVFCWDNIAAPFEGAPIDKALTCGGYVDLRILGRTGQPTYPWRTVQLGTGNNIVVGGDTVRRVVLSRLESSLENPEDRKREDYKHPDRAGKLDEWALENRCRLVVSALTLLRAFVVAGSPPLAPSWGSFERWSRLIASALVWAGGVDPQNARLLGDENRDPEKENLTAFLHAMPRDRLYSIKELVVLSKEDLRAALDTVVPFDVRGNRNHQLANALKRWIGRVVGGVKLVKGTDPHTKHATWGVKTA